MGYLVKRGHIRRNWKRRFFCLTSECLRYYAAENDLLPGSTKRPPKGTLALRSDLYGRLTVRELSGGGGGRAHSFVVSYSAGDSYELRVQAASGADRTAWIAAIEGAMEQATITAPGSGGGRVVAAVGVAEG